MFFFVSFIATLALAVQAIPVAPVARAALDVWVPHILTPNAETVWTIGEPANVTWDTSDAPEQISNGAAVQLRKGTPIGWLAQDFDLRAGYVEVTVPEDLEPGNDYSITLFGDSGNISEEFTIKAA
ncbi:uncharacterized protein SCHCODRAFT_02483770 [Schizophyllum commune H4-8]|uniref:Yeast cell wall synthesis Kre9/Knh1-like N-terminal domain-containing protein n=1 Tax=Schizophyllum commune (strain H4-8 / FGSC 9210) TaxID=578458 RepID=D8PUZ1_SCHCM|nr:uncharacterized protein SCHCODRAFT_02483770 [Schizophyllum commune H4-8]KAI5900565.1 hypothetical protein SCHCODRAFT_02483770 [Schizophyllum commune H4-8]